MTRIGFEKININNVDELLEDNNRYLLIVFGGKTILPRYNQMLYLHHKRIVKVGQSYQDRISSYLLDNETEDQVGTLKKIQLLIGAGLDSEECKEIDKEVLHKALIDLKEMGYEELEYIKL